MRTKRIISVFLFSFLIQLSLSSHGQADKRSDGQVERPGTAPERTLYYGVEIGDVLCGYATVTSIPEVKAGRKIERIEGKVNVKLSVLGGGVDLVITQTYLTDPRTEQFFYNTTTVEQGDVRMDFLSQARNDTILFRSVSGNEQKSLPLSPGMILDSPLTTIHIMNDFIRGNATEKSYMIYDPVRGEVFEKTYSVAGREELTLAGTTYNCIVLEESTPGLGFKSKQWYDRATGLNVQTLIATRKIFLADPSVVKNITTVKLDDLLFAKVNTRISDIHSIAYMKVKGKIESAGEELKPESLNAGGQTFSGTVTDNLIEGTFEITAEKYDGSNAPSFPPDFSRDKKLSKYLKPENLIESGDPLLVAKAKDITLGSADSWEAAKRLSKWVAENIEGAVPGGTSAINTYKTRQGECGSHSRLLAAFCRAVGIPSRLATGCMYTSVYGGSFGQHAWTEVYMGDAGWIPVDATAFEIDFIDAGHIRLGEKSSFNPKEMEILEYRMTGGTPGMAGDPVPAEFAPYLGKYTDLERNRVFTVLCQDKSLAVDIPGQTVLMLNERDEDGRWYPQITRQLCFRFPVNGAGEIEKLVVTQQITVPRKEGTDSVTAGIPEKLRPYTGIYSLPQAKINLAVTCKDNALWVPDLLGRNKELYKLAEKDEYFTADGDRYEFRFEKNESGKINRMVASVNFTFVRGEPAAGIIEKVIESEGIEVGLTTYMNLKAENKGEYLFTESLMNALGYRLLSKDKMNEAIGVFLQNADDYPGSFNVYDSLGEAYMKNGEKELAIEYYNKSLELNPGNENGKKMLEKINAEQ